MLRIRHEIKIALGLLILLPVLGSAQLAIDQTDPQFAALVKNELDLMKSGKRGLPCQVLVDRIEKAPALTTIKPVTSDEATWHPNDLKGTRSHVAPLDTRVRGATRNQPTAVILYLHPSRIDPALSLFKLGTFAHTLAQASDFNTGQFSSDYRIQEKRATFFRNAWRDSLKLSMVEISDRVPTPEYEEAKKAGFIKEEYVDYFPLLSLEGIQAKQTKKEVTDISGQTVWTLDPQKVEPKTYVGRFGLGSSFVKVSGRSSDGVLVRYGNQLEGVFEIYEAKIPLNTPALEIPLSSLGADFSSLKPYSTLVKDAGPWEKEIQTVN